MSGKKIGLILALDGEREFTAAVQAAQKSTKLFEAQLKGLAEKFEGNANSMDYLRQKQDLLKQQQGAYQKQLEAAQAGQKKANENYREQSKRLEELEKQLKSAKQAQELMESSGQQGTREYEEQAKAVAELEKAVEKQTIARTKEVGSISEWDKKVYEAEKSLKKQNDEIEKNEQYLKEAEQATDHCATSIDKMGQEAKQTSQEMEELGDTADDVTQVTTTLGDKFKTALVTKGVDLAGNAVRKVGEAAKKAAEYAIEVGSSFEAAMSEVAAISGAAGEELTAMEEKAKELGASTKFSATEVAEAFKYMSLAGWSTSDMLSGIDGVLNLAAASGMELAAASDMLTDYLSAFGMQASQSAYMADLLAFAQANSNTTAEQLGEAYQNCAANMNAAGQDIETTTSLLEAMANQGTKGSKAGTQLSAIMRDITSKMKDGKIAIGDTAVEVADAQGNFRDLTDILTDVEAATDGMGDAEKKAALQTTFTADSINGLSLVLNEGMGKISGYETALRNSGGAAKDMADIMNDNLKGDLTEAESALEGLGIAAYDYVEGPVRGVVQGVTGIIQGITEAITPQKTAVEELVESIQTANDGLQTTLQNADTTMQNAELEAGKIETLGAQLISLNGVEEKSLAQKYQLKEIVSELGGSIPEIAAAYGEEAGKVNLTDAAIQRLIGSTKELIIAQAAQNAMQEVATQLVEAQIALKDAETAQSVAADKKAMYEEEKQLLQELQNEYDQYTQALSSAADGDAVAKIEANYTNAAEVERRYLEFWNEQLASGRATIEEYDAALENVGIGQLSNRLVKNENDCAQWNDTLSEADKSVAELAEGVSEANAKVETYSEAVKEAEDALKAEDEALSANADSSAHAAAEKDRLASEARNETGAIEENTDAVNVNAEAQKAAAQNIKDAYESARSEIESSLQNKISLTDMFDGGEDITTEQMNENLQSYLDGIENYKENLVKVRAMTDESGKALFSPEVMAEIEKGGLEYANMLSHMVYTWEEQGEYGYEQNKEIARKWAGALNVTEEMSEVQAANRVAMEQLTGELGSTDVEFSALGDAVDEAVASAAKGWAGLPEATKTALEDTITTAQQCGVKIPEGLAEGIASGEISPEAALEQLNGTIQGTFDGLAEIAKQQGITVTDEMSAGIANGGQAAVDAYNELIGLLAQKSAEARSAGEEAGSEAAGGTQSAIQSGTPAVEQASSEMAGAAATAAGGKKDEFQTAGQQSAQAYIDALNAQKAQAAQAGGAIASSARSALASWENSFYSAGYSIPAGVADGIYGGTSGAVNAAASMAAQTLAAAKAALEIHSPSRKFRQEVGQNIPESTAFGIKDKASLAGKAASKMSAKVYANATSWLAKYKKSQQVSIADEKWYWQQVLAHTKKGTTAYKNVLKKIENLSVREITATGLSSGVATKITKNFGVSKTTGSGKKKKTKDTETYYGEIYSAAEKYISNQQALNDWSLQQELAYWNAVKGQLKKGTQAWYDATKQINSVQADIAAAQKEALKTQASVQDDILDKYKVYYKVSAKAEMDYWNTARKQFKTGTDERIEADRKYLEAMQEWYGQRKELDEDYLESSKDINDQLADSVKELQDAYKDAVAERKQDILSSMGLFEAWDADGYTMDTLLHNLQTQVAGLALWEQQLEKLKERGISTGLYDYLLEQGPDAAANIYSLANATDGQLAEYEKLFEQKNALAQSQAVKDNETLRQETNKEIAQLRTEAQAELNMLNADYRAALQELNTGIDQTLLTLVNKAGSIGEDAVSELTGGIKKAADSVNTYQSTAQLVTKVAGQLSELEKEGKEIGSGTLDGILAAMSDDTKIQNSAQQVIQSIKRAMEDAAEIHSPSRLFRRETGPQIPAGVALGVEDGTPAAVKSAQEMMQETLDAAQEEMEKRQTEMQATVPDYSGVMRLNRMLEEYRPQAPVVNVDNSAMMEMMRQMVQVMQGMAEGIENTQVVLDTGALVGNIQKPMSQENAAVTGRRRRPR